MPPLKPGQKIDLKIVRKKVANLQKLENQAINLNNSYNDLKYTITGGSKSIEKKLQELRTEIKNEIGRIKQLMAPSREGDVTKIIRILEKDCSEALALYKSSRLFMFRGTRSKSPKMAYIGRARDDRNPMDSQIIAQKLYDMLLTKRKIVAQRHNSIFVTSNYLSASDYANGMVNNIFIIFPKNGFNYSWSPKKQDLVLELEEFSRKKVLDLKKVSDFKKKLIQISNERKMKKPFFLKPYFNIIDHIYQVKRFIKKYKLDFDFDLEIAKVIKFDVLNKIYNPVNTRIKKALEHKHEILINGEYIALNADMFTNMLSKRYGQPKN